MFVVNIWPTVNNSYMYMRFSHAGLATDTYKYYNPNTCMFDPEGAYDSLKVNYHMHYVIYGIFCILS